MSKAARAKIAAAQKARWSKRKGFWKTIRNASAEEKRKMSRRRPSHYQRIGQGALGKSEGRAGKIKL